MSYPTSGHSSNIKHKAKNNTYKQKNSLFSSILHKVKIEDNQKLAQGDKGSNFYNLHVMTRNKAAN